MSTPTIDHLVRYFGTVRGTDKTLMFVQYTTKILANVLKERNADLAQRFGNLSSPISDFRILLRYYGLVPMIQWILNSEKMYPQLIKEGKATKSLFWYIRLENLLMVLYYPLEHAYWLGWKKIIPMTDETLGKIGVWSCRFWLAYVVAYFLHLWEEYKLASSRQAILSKKEKTEETKKELQEIVAEKKRIAIESYINFNYLPLTVHWSLESSSFPEVGVGIFGMLASFGQIYNAWQSTK